MLVFALLFFYQTYSRTNERISQVVNQQAALALQFDLSIRKYVASFIRPAMYELTSEDEFFPETMSTSYIARSIFEDVQKEFPDYIIKFSSDNPRNSLNQAGLEELKIIEKFNKNPQLKQWESQITIDNKKYLAKFSARRMVTSCARCHGDPKDAPASLIEKYGDKAGFYRNIGDVLGLDTVAIPMVKIVDQQRSEFLKISFLGGFGIVLFFTLSSLITRYLIINRLSFISKHFLKVAQKKDYSQIQPIEIKGNDEISDLSASFNIMSERLKVSYAFLNDQVNQRTVELQNEIIEHKRSENKLRQSEEKFRSAFKTSPNGITLSSMGDGIFDDINDGFTRLLGYTRKEVIGKSSFELNIWYDLKDRDRLISGLSKDGFVENLEAKFIGKSGQIIDGLMSARTLDIDDKNHLLTVTQDITQLRKNEQDRLNLEIRLQQAQKMEAIGTLAGGIAHDFNNILSGIFGYSQLALKRIDNPQKVKNCISQIDKGSKRAAELVRQILTFSRQDIYQKHPLQISIAIKEALQLLRSSIPTSIEIKKRIDSDSAVLADPIKIHQLLINLCTNAYHAIGENNGSIIISLVDKKIQKSKKVNNTRIPPGDYLELEVADTGSGMDKSILEKIFDPYFTTKQVGQGTGIGLALVKAIVKEHEGFISVNSVSGQGTSFFIYFPVFQKKADQMSSATNEINLVNGNERIMIVDDEKAIRDVSEEIIKSHGYKVSVFENGSKALCEFQKDPNKFDLIITDMAMPKMSGEKLAIEMLKKNPKIPVLLCTGFSETLSEEKASSIGIRKIFNKPLEMNALLKNIREILDEKSRTVQSN